jgi:hypothetical protein
MYGIINKAVESFVRTRHGDAIWDRVRQMAGLPDEPFVSTTNYADASTFLIVAAASRVVGLPAEQVLEAFGTYWVEFVFAAGYGLMVLSPGDTLSTAFRRLDEMHDRIQGAFPESRAPSFSVVHESAHGITVDYRSDREGLAPFVSGVIRGIGLRIGSEVVTRHERVQPDEGPAHDRFHVTWPASSPTSS